MYITKLFACLFCNDIVSIQPALYQRQNKIQPRVFAMTNHGVVIFPAPEVRWQLASASHPHHIYIMVSSPIRFSVRFASVKIVILQLYIVDVNPRDLKRNFGISVEEKFEGNMRILKRKSRFRAFRDRWIRISGSRIEIRKESDKTIFKFSKPISWAKNSKSKSNFKFWGPDWSFFGKPNSLKIEISNFGRVDFCILIKFQSKISILEGIYTKIFLASR